jgi:RNA polymerase sigma-70 factor (ECF subfamily)
VRIAANVVRDHLRSRRLRFWRRAQREALDTAVVADWLPDPAASQEQVVLISERLASVWEATGALSDRQRTVFLLRFVEDMDIGDIATATGLTTNAVNVHLFRAVRAVRKHVRNGR